jgi:hypothetical protein
MIKMPPSLSLSLSFCYTCLALDNSLLFFLNKPSYWVLPLKCSVSLANTGFLWFSFFLPVKVQDGV